MNLTSAELRSDIVSSGNVIIVSGSSRRSLKIAPSKKAELRRNLVDPIRLAHQDTGRARHRMVRRRRCEVERQNIRAVGRGFATDAGNRNNVGAKSVRAGTVRVFLARIFGWEYSGDDVCRVLKYVIHSAIRFLHTCFLTL